MMVRLKQNPASVFGILGVYFLAQICVRLLLPHSLELDESAQIFYAQWPSLGYDTQPPFYNWVQTAVLTVVGTSVFSLALVKNTFLFLTYLFFGLAAMRMVRSKELAVVAVFGILTIPQLVFESQRDLTHSVAAVFASALFIFALVSTLDRPSWKSYAVLGLSVGIGFLSKYNFALLPAAAFLAVLFDTEFRRRLIDLRILIAALVASLVILPHALWLLNHLDLATQGTLNKLEGAGTSSKLLQIATGTASLFGALLGFAGLTFSIFLILYGRKLQETLGLDNRWSLLLGRIMLAAIGLLLLLILITDSTNIKDRWLSPIFPVLALYFATKLDQLDSRETSLLARIWPLAKFILVAMPLVMLLRVPAHGWLGDYTKLNLNYDAALQEASRHAPVEPTVILASDVHLAGNLRLLKPNTQVVVNGYRALTGPIERRESTLVLVMWRAQKESDMPDSARSWLAAAGEPRSYTGQTVAVPYNYGRDGDTFMFGYAFVWIDPKAP
ncbi:ArnT family glycosyltransferase [Rhizobium rhizophilum]|uniref:Glycosyltransferase RgtA/B/C/D-like domain-containing protein n=1 Tax=Rhizobium rhizophilum TaxID=1850373 RepID=A0ABY2QVA3_9HYPH|nr:glycosyltransferase family 39 protein [Rhizobium rhizophilum]THV14151.1 hypothetical protein E9677_14825 [Rhizobium rhizophilum]